MSFMAAKKMLLARQQPYAMVNDTIVSSMRINSHSEEVTAAGMFRDGGELRSVSFSKASGSNPPMLRLNRLSNGALIDSFQYRAAQFNGGTAVEASGAFFDGADLITVEKVLSNVHKHVGISDNYRASFRTAETQGQSLGLSVSRDGIATAYNDKLTFYSGFSNTVAKTVTLAKSYFGSRFCFDGRNVVFAESGANRLHVHNPQTGALLKSVDLSGKVSGVITSISFDGANIHVWSNSGNLVYKLGRG